MKNKKTDILVWSITLITIIITLIIYPNLDRQIITHWGANGAASAPADKINLIYMLILIVASNLLFIVIAKIDPKKENYKKFSRVYNIFRVVFSIYMSFMVGLIIVNYYKPNLLDISILISVSVWVLLVILGNYLPKCKHNYTFGIKTPWTLADETVWDKTHRMAGPIWVVSGLIAIIASCFLPKYTNLISIVMLMPILIIPITYSYLEFKKIKRSSKDEEL